MAERHKWYIIQSKCFRKEGKCFEESDRLKIVVLGIIGLLILIGTGIFIFIGQSICTMAGVGLFVIVCLGMVTVAGKKMTRQKQ